jgi:hypothetical protein
MENIKTQKKQDFILQYTGNPETVWGFTALGGAHVTYFEILKRCTYVYKQPQACGYANNHDKFIARVVVAKL